MEFRLLGPLEVTHEGRDHTPTAPKIRQLLALLVLRANQVVSLDSIVEELWGNEPPRSAVTTAQTYIYQLRRTFARELGEEAVDRMIVTTAPGYLLRLRDDQVDACRFDTLIDQARLLADVLDHRAASHKLRTALQMWSGPVLANVSFGRMLQTYATHLEERRVTAIETRVKADMDLGRHREIIAELRDLARAHPYNEWLQIQLITALARSGRRGDALNAYQSARRVLNEELGLDPSIELQQIHREVLTVGGPVATIGARHLAARQAS